MNNHNNKKIKVPGILIAFVVIVLVGFSGLTYAIAQKMSDSDLGFAKTGLSNLIGVFNTKIEINKDERVATGEINTIIEVEETATPSPTPSATPTPLSSNIKPTPTPKKTPTPTPTPAPSPTPTPKPTLCSTKLTYTISYIDGQFIQNGYDRNRLKDIVLYAESQWESSLGADIFRYDSEGTSENTIRFTQDAPMTIHNYYSGQFGQTRTYGFDENGVIIQFEIEIFAGIFPFVDGHPVFTGPIVKGYSLTESIIARSVMHHMGHAIGLDYLPGGQSGVMAKTWIPTAFKPTMSQDDRNWAKVLCK